MYNPQFDSKKRKNALEPLLNRRFAGFIFRRKYVAQILFF